ncbi:MAG: outer membrane lipid asymmetry maintenance protein MlaD [Pseudomonadota bacterium]
MSENTTEVLVGGAVLAIAGFFLFYAGQSTGFGDSAGGSYELNASFRSAQGVGVGTDVRLAGVKVGTVTAMELNPQTFRADVTFSVQESIDVPDDSAAVIASEGLLGGNFVELNPGGSPFNYAAGDQVLDTQGSVSLIQLLLQFASNQSEG